MRRIDQGRKGALFRSPVLGLALLSICSVACRGAASVDARPHEQDSSRGAGGKADGGIQRDGAAWEQSSDPEGDPGVISEPESPGSNQQQPMIGGVSIADCDLSPAPPPSSASVAATSHPSILLNTSEIDAIQAKVKAGAEPWAGAYRQLIATADAAKKIAPRSVRTEGNTGADYFTGHPYCGWGTGASSPCGQDCCDGVSNPNTDRGDYEAAIQISHAVRDLGLAYAFTKDASYAEHAVVLMRQWAVNSATAMSPKFTNNSSEIELSITMPAMFYGADLIWSYSGWTDRAAFTRWVAALATDVRGKGTGTAAQNFGDWRLVLLGSAAVVTEDEELLQYVFDHYKKLVPNQISAKGELALEITRTKALFYSLYAVNAISQVCELARHHGVDLYHYAAPSGAGSLEKALDWLAPYVLNPASWPYQQITPLTVNDNIATFELGYFAWGKANYLSAVQKFGRPLVDNRTAGPLTLTHARGAFPWQLSTPSAAPVAPSYASVSADKRSGPAPLSVAFNGAQSSLAGAAPESFAWDFGDGGSSTQSAPAHTFTAPGCYAVKLSVTRGTAQKTTTFNVRVDDPEANGLQAESSWKSMTIAAQEGRFRATFEMTASAANMNGVTGFARNAATDYAQLGAIVRFSPEGFIDARNGGAYAAAATLPYSAGTRYHVRMEIDVGAHSYSVFVTPAGETEEITIASDYAFRSEQSAVEQLDHVSVYATEGTYTLENLVIEAL